VSEVTLGKIRKVNKPQGVVYTVQLPEDWASEQLAKGNNHVVLSRYHGHGNELVLTPMADAHVKEYRLQKRREAGRAAYRRRTGQA
jgi:hypothetical protein